MLNCWGCDKRRVDMRRCSRNGHLCLAWLRKTGYFNSPKPKPRRESLCLSELEKEVIHLRSIGFQRRHISKQCNMPVQAVSNALVSACNKLGAETIGEAIQLWGEYSLVALRERVTP